MTSAAQLENLEGLKRKLTIEMPWDDINATVNKEVKKIQSTARIDGFRPGKVPEKIIQTRYGAAIKQDAIFKCIDKRLKQEFTDRALNVIEISSIEPEQTEPNAPLKFSAWFEVLPEIVLKDLEGQVIHKRSSSIEEKDVDEVLTRLQTQYKEWVEVEKAAALQDKLVIDFIGYRNGEPFAGGKAEGAELILGSKQFIPGFEESLVGVKVGDQKTISVTFPEHYHEASLAGAETTFDVTVHKVLEGRMRELDEAFAKLLGVNEGGIEALRAELKQGLEREVATALREENKKRVLDKLRAINVFEVPNSLVQEEIERIQRVIEAQAAKQKRKIQPMDNREHLEKQARENVITGLLMREVIKKFNLKVEASHVRALLDEKMSAYEDPTQMMQLYYNSEALLEQVQGEAMEVLVVDALLATATIEEERVAYETAIRGGHDHHDHDHDHDHHHDHHDHDHDHKHS